MYSFHVPLINLIMYYLHLLSNCPLNIRNSIAFIQLLTKSYSDLTGLNLFFSAYEYMHAVLNLLTTLSNALLSRVHLYYVTTLIIEKPIYEK